MIHWFDEIQQLFKHPIDEVGAVFFVREKMNNDWTADGEQLRLVFGQDWERIVESLRSDGILNVVRDGVLFRLSVTAPGDRKRRRTALINRKRRRQSKGTTGTNKE